MMDRVKRGGRTQTESAEQRTGLAPAGARALAEPGDRVIGEAGAGAGSGIRDDEFARVGAALGSVDDVWGGAELILKVKEPLAVECARLRPGQIIFTYLHLAAEPALTQALRKSGAIAIAYETVQ